jgi:hypothetical protein
MSGTLQDHPGRYKDRANEPTNLDELGRAPTYMSEEEKKIWKELAPDGSPEQTDTPLNSPSRS